MNTANPFDATLTPAELEAAAAQLGKPGAERPAFKRDNFLIDRATTHVLNLENALRKAEGILSRVAQHNMGPPGFQTDALIVLHDVRNLLKQVTK